MRPTASSAAHSPTRRALHERVPSETNKEASSSSLRLVTDRENSNVPSTNPCPTKTEHVLSPSSGQKNSTVPVADIQDVNSDTRSSATAEKSIADLWDLPYVFDSGNRESQPLGRSSRSSFPEAVSPQQPGLSRCNENPEDSDDDDIAVLPADAPTIKTVVSEPPSPNSSTPGPSRIQGAAVGDSSPNIVPIGPPSSPNFVALDSSSLDFAPIGNSSSNSGSASRSNSVKSLNSMGTVVRHVGAAPWIHSSTPEHSSSHSRSRSQSFRSTPPVASIKSGSIVSRGHSRSGSGAESGNGSGTVSSRSAISGSDIHPNHDSGVFIQYPILRGPPSSSSRAESYRPATTGRSAQGSLVDRPFEPRNRSLTTVSSQRSAEYGSNIAASAGASMENTSTDLPPPPAALSRQKSSSSLWSATDPEKNEHLDFLAKLPPALTRPGNPAVPSSSSSGSRSSSLRSNKRPGTGASHILNIAPAWARAYYQSDGQAINYALSLFDGSRPSSARSNASNAITYLPAELSRPRTRHNNEITHDMPQRKASDPRDPRSHWVLGPELENGSRPGTSRSQIRGSWSPHLYPDRHAVQHKTSTWDAVSMHSYAEPTFGPRNIQVYSFCLGFIFPFAWMIAALLPLPPPAEVQESKNGPDLERTLKMRAYDVDQRRHENARWWRNLNRLMVPLGIVIIVLVIVLAVVGTTVGF